MLFNSHVFILVFLPIALMGFFLIGRSGRYPWAIAWLVVVSLVFYGWWNPVCLIIIIGSILFNYYLTYDNYLQARMVKKSYSKGIIIDKNGQSNTKKLAVVAYTNHDGTASHAYPAADYCNLFERAGTKHLGGSWWLSSVWEFE